MNSLHKILEYSYPIVKYSKSIVRTFSSSHNLDLRVLIYHDIAKQEHSKFIHHLEFLSKEWKFLTPSDFEIALFNPNSLEGKFLLLTFDDGFSSNRRIAEEILNLMGIKAIFFIVPNFISLATGSEVKKFISKNIIPTLSIEDVSDEMMPMTWNDLNYLVETGHTIGSHTLTHAKLSEIDEIKLLEEEIVSPKKILESKLGVNINHFAYTFGDINSFNKKSLSIARKHYDFIYTGLRGNNTNRNPWAIRRDSIQTNISRKLISSFLEGGADLIYKNNLKTFESWGMD